MPPKVKVSSTVIKKLKCIKVINTGRLFGVMCHDSLTVMNLALNFNGDDDEFTININDLQLNMPAEIDLCGVLFIGECKEDIPTAFKDIDITDNPILMKYSLKSSHVSLYYYIHEKLVPAGDLEIINEDDIWKTFYYIRLRSTIPMMTEKSQLTEAFQKTRKNVASGIAGFNFLQNNIFLLNNESDTKEINIKELIKNSHKTISDKIDTINVEMFIRITDEKSKKKYAPVLQQITKPFEYIQFNLNIDTLSLVGSFIKASQLYSILVESVIRSLRLVEGAFIKQLNNNSTLIPQILHFKPPSFSHIITLVYPAKSLPEDTKEYRKSLHKVFAMDLTKPYFRNGNAIKFSNDSTSNDLILQPHRFISSITAAEYIQISLVKGLYSYHHYMQDNFNDSGWGCAYRSLQTIFSWFSLQGYTDKPIPSHRDIQKCLVDIGDKPANFIGSKQWIGSTEVGFVLESLLGISVKVLCSSSGGKMSELSWELKEHFDTQETPVMIGGGVLAHTILGIRFNEADKDIQWLILDPHYEGSDNLSVIISKNWCGWKGKEFWRKDSFYNMCLPQKPICF